MSEAELRALYDEVHEAYLEALEAHRKAVKLERRYQEALKAHLEIGERYRKGLLHTCKELARLQGELTGDGASAHAPGASHHGGMKLWRFVNTWLMACLLLIRPVDGVPQMQSCVDKRDGF